MKVGIALADVLAGKDAAISILAALLERDGSTEALPWQKRSLTVSLAHSATAALINVAQNALVSGSAAARWGNQHPNLVPYQLFRAADRHIVVAVGSDEQWRSACRALSLHELAEDESLATNRGRVENRARVSRLYASRIAGENAEYWLGRLHEAGVPCGVVSTVHEALSSVAASPVTGVSPSVPGSVRLPPPSLDEHGDLIRRRGWEAFSELS
jgi:crotonobetainyl-CoA:carnitine CoA-transferase CaiB-like acyl-CoA transferase